MPLSTSTYRPTAAMKPLRAGSTPSGINRVRPTAPIDPKTGLPMTRPTGPATRGAPSVFGGLGSLLAGAGPAAVGAINAGAKPAAAAVAKPVQTLQNAVGGPQKPSNPNQRPNGPQSYGASNYMAATPYAMLAQQLAQNNAMQTAVGQGNNTLVSGPLQSVSGPSGDLQNAGLYNAWYNSVPKAQQTIGAMGDVGDARWQANQAAGMTGYGDQGQVYGSGGGGGVGGTGNSAAGGGAAGTGVPNALQTTADKLMAEYQAAQDAYNAEVDQRYNSGLGMLQDAQRRGMGEIDRLGRSEAQNIRDTTRRSDAQTVQGMTGRGLANTTSLPVLRNAIQREGNKASVALGDTLARQRLAADRAYTGDVTSWMSNNSPTGPNMDQMSNLIMALGQSGYGQPQNAPFDINDFLSKLGGLPNFQVPNMGQVPMMGMPQFGTPQGAIGNAGAQGQPGQGGRPFQMSGTMGNIGAPGLAGGAGSPSYGFLPGMMGGLGLLGSQYAPGIASGLAGAYQYPSQIGNDLGSWIHDQAQGVGDSLMGASDYMKNLWLQMMGAPQLLGG